MTCPLASTQRKTSPALSSQPMPCGTLQGLSGPHGMRPRPNSAHKPGPAPPGPPWGIVAPGNGLRVCPDDPAPLSLCYHPQKPRFSALLCQYHGTAPCPLVSYTLQRKGICRNDARFPKPPLCCSARLWARCWQAGRFPAQRQPGGFGSCATARRGHPHPPNEIQGTPPAPPSRNRRGGEGARGR